MSRNKEELSPYMIERYRIRLDHDVRVEPEDPGDLEDLLSGELYRRAEPPLIVEIMVDSLACVPKEEIVKILLERLQQGCYAKWCEEPTDDAFPFEIEQIDVIRQPRR